MRFVIANLLVFSALAVIGLFAIWTLGDIHWIARVLASVAWLFAAGYLEERLASRLVNRILSGRRSAPK
jgi:hypothetical protein